MDVGVYLRHAKRPKMLPDVRTLPRGRLDAIYNRIYSDSTKAICLVSSLAPC